MAAAAPHPQGMPGVQDGCLGSGEKHEALDRAALGVAAGLVPVHDLGEAHEPVPIMAAGSEGPLPAELESLHPPSHRSSHPHLPLVRAGSPRETRAADRWRVGRTVPSIILSPA